MNPPLTLAGPGSLHLSPFQTQMGYGLSGSGVKQRQMKESGPPSPDSNEIPPPYLGGARNPQKWKGGGVIIRLLMVLFSFWSVYYETRLFSFQSMNDSHSGRGARGITECRTEHVV